MTVSIVIPAFNEGPSIAGVVAHAAAYGTPIVIDDGSSDDTGARAAEAGAVVVRHEANRGYDQALASGFAEAERRGAEAIVTIDADGQLDSAAIPPTLKALARGDVALVLGVRSGGAARFSEALFNRYARMRFGVPDILCGLKGFRMDAYAARRARAAVDSVHTALALCLLREGATFALVPVKVRPRRGQSRYGGIWRANFRILRALCGAIGDDARGRGRS